MKILYIDMDGVVANFVGAIKEHYPEMDNETIPYPERQTNTEMVCCHTNPRIFLDLPPIKDIEKYISPLMDRFDTYFLSTPMWIQPFSYMDKRLWLENYFGERVRDRLILTKRKDLQIGDFLVDDTTMNGVSGFKGEHIHFGSEKFPDWEAIFPYLISKQW